MAESVALSRTCTVGMRQPWLRSAAFDGVFVMAPMFVISFFVLLYAGSGFPFPELTTAQWVLLVVGVDVAHVYSTVFRTYLKTEELQKHRERYILLPLLVFLVSVALYSLGSIVFWRALAYTAVFHFVRQQYGFMMLYKREEPRNSWGHRLDISIIYAATLLPLAYWHAHLPRNFHWFMEGDFVKISHIAWFWAVCVAAAILGAAYLGKEIYSVIRHRRVNIPKNLLVAGTALSWSVGICGFNDDLVFTATNIAAHGIPYMALIWAVERFPTRYPAPITARATFQNIRSSALVFFLGYGFLASLAYIEEGLWDAWIWREHASVFPVFAFLRPVSSEAYRMWLVPLLALPQATHYVLDGFIWKVKTTTPLLSTTSHPWNGDAS